MQREMQTTYGTVNNANTKALRDRKMKIHRKISTKFLVIATSSILLLTSLISYKFGRRSVEQEPFVVPQNQVVLTIPVRVHSNQFVSDIASKYYNDNVDLVYKSYNQYIKAIAETNNLENPDKINSWDILNVPVVIDKENPYYLKMMEIKSKIATIENDKNLFWVDYTTKNGDTWWTLAQKACYDVGEVPAMMYTVSRKNNAEPSDYVDTDDNVQIANPELGVLKRELALVSEEFYSSLEKQEDQEKQK